MRDLLPAIIEFLSFRSWRCHTVERDARQAFVVCQQIAQPGAELHRGIVLGPYAPRKPGRLHACQDVALLRFGVVLVHELGKDGGSIGRASKSILRDDFPRLYFSHLPAQRFRRVASFIPAE